MAPALLDSAVAEWAFAAIASKAIATGSFDEKAMICTFFVFNLQPFQKFIYPSDKTNNTALIVVDLSPSIQAYKNIDDYKEVKKRPIMKWAF